MAVKEGSISDMSKKNWKRSKKVSRVERERERETETERLRQTEKGREGEGGCILGLRTEPTEAKKQRIQMESKEKGRK